MRSGQIAFSFDETPETEDVPCLYLACPLTSVDATDRQLLDSLCAHIVNTVTETCTQSEDRWDVGVHAQIAAASYYHNHTCHELGKRTSAPPT